MRALKGIHSIGLLALMVVLVSCLKEDKPVQAHTPGNAVTANANMGTNYRFQYYFDIENNSFVGQNLKSIWDLAFDSRDGKFTIFLNGAKLTKVANTNVTDMSLVTDTLGANWRVDVPSGNYDSTAIGNWGTIGVDTVLSANNVYVADRGYDEDDNPLGVVKFKVDGANNKYYRVTFANLDGTGLSTIDVPKDTSYNFTYLSFNAGGSVPLVEPPKHTWDIAITQYTHIFYIPYLPYLVTGGVLNRTAVRAAADSTSSYDSFAIADTASYAFTSNTNIIGYDWKQFNFQTQLYTVKNYKNYIIRSRHGRYFKLRFTDFYKDGVKGNIVFEFQEL